MVATDDPIDMAADMGWISADDAVYLHEIDPTTTLSPDDRDRVDRLRNRVQARLLRYQLDERERRMT